MDLDRKIMVLGASLMISSLIGVGGIEAHCGKRHHEPSIQPQKQDTKKEKTEKDKSYQKLKPKYTPPTEMPDSPLYR